MSSGQSNIGVIGLAVMGQNLVLNMADNGWNVSVFNRTPNKTEEFLEGPAAASSVLGFYDIESFVQSLERPRRVMLMIKAGHPVDTQIEALLPLLESGDVVIDGGNSLYTDSERRCNELAELGIHFVGTGISGGEDGARHGPSIMPGGDPSAWPLIEDLF
ncbi:MAG: NAD(P)-binding domain-containing protein, partial [Acidimicrobiia bacterium]